MSKKKQKRIKKKPMGIALIIILTGLCTVAILFFLLNKVRRTYVLEAGVLLQAEQLLTEQTDKEICFEDGTKEFTETTPGVYHVKLRVGSFVHTVKITVQDTISPTAVACERIIPYNTVCEAKDLVTNVEDASKVTIDYVKAPDFSIYGEQDVQISLTDEAGNQVHLTSKILIPKVDTENPNILEAGDRLPDPKSLLLAEGEIAYEFDANSVDIHTPGIYPVTVSVDDYKAKIQFQVQDTVQPKITLMPMNWYLNSELEPSSFVAQSEDETQLTYAYATPPSMNMEGEQEITIIATDLGNNSTTMKTTLTLEPDKEAPIIYGIGNLSVCMGENVSYKKGVSVTDNCDALVTLNIDNSAVDLNTIGTYPVIYSATDTAGNTVSQTVDLTVMPERLVNYSQDEMYALADVVLAKIINDSMSMYDKAQAIYIWTKGNISFIENSEKEDWVESAYNGFTYHKGDCYTYACVSKALLTRAGIPNIDIQRLSTRSHHYWNLVDCGEGWYHFDATPRTDKTTIFMWSENEILADPAVARTHVYDHSLYPVVNPD